jgi:hypothetical protein
MARSGGFISPLFPFTLFYRVPPKVGATQVLAVAHQRRRPGYWKERSV